LGHEILEILFLKLTTYQTKIYRMNKQGNYIIFYSSYLPLICFFVYVSFPSSIFQSFLQIILRNEHPCLTLVGEILTLLMGLGGWSVTAIQGKVRTVMAGLTSNLLHQSCICFGLDRILHMIKHIIFSLKHSLWSSTRNHIQTF